MSNTYLHPDIYDPEGSVDNIIANGKIIILFDAYSNDFANIMAAKIFGYSPIIVKSAEAGGFKATIPEVTNQTETTNTGVVNHWAILDTVNSKVLAVGEADGSTITAGQPFNLPEYSIVMPKQIVTP